MKSFPSGGRWSWRVFNISWSRHWRNGVVYSPSTKNRINFESCCGHRKNNKRKKRRMPRHERLCAQEIRVNCHWRVEVERVTTQILFGKLNSIVCWKQSLPSEKKRTHFPNIINTHGSIGVRVECCHRTHAKYVIVALLIKAVFKLAMHKARTHTHTRAAGPTADLKKQLQHGTETIYQSSTYYCAPIQIRWTRKKKKQQRRPMWTK